MSRKIFLLSPANTSGRRAQLLFNERAEFPLAVALRGARGATLGEVFSFLSGLYFRGKLVYARAFARAPRGVPPILVSTSDRGLLSPDVRVTLADLRAFAGSPIAAGNATYRAALRGAAGQLAKQARGAADVVLLRCVDSAAELTYVRVAGAVRTGKRPPRLKPR